MKKPTQVVRQVIKDASGELNFDSKELQFARRSGLGYRFKDISERQEKLLNLIFLKAQAALPIYNSGQVQDTLAQVVNNPS